MCRDERAWGPREFGTKRNRPGVVLIGMGD